MEFPNTLRELVEGNFVSEERKRPESAGLYWLGHKANEVCINPSCELPGRYEAVWEGGRSFYCAEHAKAWARELPGRRLFYQLTDEGPRRLAGRTPQAHTPEPQV